MQTKSSADVILVVDDEVLVRMAIAEYLRDCGYKVIEAASADEAVAVLEHRGTRVDIVFSDIEMPGSMDGFGLSRWTRTRRPELRVVLAGTIPKAVDVAAGLCDSSTVSKPYDPQLVHHRIRRLLAGRHRKV